MGSTKWCQPFRKRHVATFWKTQSTQQVNQRSRDAWPRLKKIKIKNFWSKPQSYALNSNNVFGWPLDEGATNRIGIVKITSHVRPYGSSISIEPNVQVDCLSKGVVHGQSTWTFHITPCVNKRVIHAQSTWTTTWHLEILKYRFTHVCGRFEP